MDGKYQLFGRLRPDEYAAVTTVMSGKKNAGRATNVEVVGS